MVICELISYTTPSHADQVILIRAQCSMSSGLLYTNFNTLHTLLPCVIQLPTIDSHYYQCVRTSILVQSNLLSK